MNCIYEEKIKSGYEKKSKYCVVCKDPTELYICYECKMCQRDCCCEIPEGWEPFYKQLNKQTVLLKAKKRKRKKGEDK